MVFDTVCAFDISFYLFPLVDFFIVTILHEGYNVT